MSFSIRENIALKDFTVFKIGGPARFFAVVSSQEELQKALQFAREKSIPFFIAGAGSNMLVSDRGWPGIFIRNEARNISIDDTRVCAESGAMMAAVAAVASRAGLSGFEWGVGIPGTVGGSVRGNAGCFGREIKDVLAEVLIFDINKAISFKLQATSGGFGYRDSVFKKNPQWIVCSAVFSLKHGNPEVILETMRIFSEERFRSQDIGAKCAGCIFKNISWNRKDIRKEELIKRFPLFLPFISRPGISAGFLVDEAGLKGRRIGGAVISRKHANFIINEGSATAEDVVMLIALVKEHVHRKFGILLEEEIQYVGFE